MKVKLVAVTLYPSILFIYLQKLFNFVFKQIVLYIVQVEMKSICNPIRP